MTHAHHRVGIALGLVLTIYACGRTSSDRADSPSQGGLSSIANPGGASAAGAPGQAGSGHGGGELTGAGATVTTGAVAGQGGSNALGGLTGANGGQAGDGVVGGGAFGAGANQGGGSEGGAGAGGEAGGDGAIGTIEIVGDTSWRTYGTNVGEAPPAGWNTAAFDDSTWVASVAPNPGACGTYEPIQPWERANAPMWDVSDKYSAFFRKIVTLPAGATVSYAKITSFADDDIEIWVNGVQAFVEDNFGVIVGGVIEPHEIDLKPFLHPGANLIAIHAQDTIGGCRWAIVSGSVGVTSVAP